MNILQISNALSFSGRSVQSKTLSYDSIKRMPEYHPSSLIEATIGWNHKVPREKVYFADPMEPISEDLKRSVDYVVYDNEPEYPEIEDVRKNYLEHNRTNYRKKFEEIREYFYRREMGGFANVEEAKNEQRKAAECTGFYDRAGDLRYKKETTEDEISKLSAKRNAIQEGINSTLKEVEAQKKLKISIDTHIDNLEKLKKPYKDIIQLVESGIKNENEMYETAEKRILSNKTNQEYLEQLKNTAYYYEGESASHGDTIPSYEAYANTTATYDSINNLKNTARITEKSVAQKQIKSINAAITSFKKIQKDCGNVIKDMQAYIAGLRIQSGKIDGQIMIKNSFIDDCKSKLETHFEQLKKFYIDNGIKIAKK